MYYPFIDIFINKTLNIDDHYYQWSKGSCWAFSAVAAMEGAHKLKAGKLIPLSEKELVDCDTKGEDEGCNGGPMDDAFDFIQRNGGLTTESNNPD